MISTNIEISNDQQVDKKAIKCVVWDLDNTLWDGVLLEDDCISLRNEVVDVIKTLDGRGILQSIASKNDDARAMEKIRSLGYMNIFSIPKSIGTLNRVLFKKLLSRLILV